MDMKRIKLILSICAAIVAVVIISIIFSTNSKLKEIQNAKPGVTWGSQSEFKPEINDETVKVMNMNIDDYTDVDRAKFEVEMEEELEESYASINEEKRLENNKLLEKRLAEEERQRDERVKMGDIAALASKPRVLPGETTSVSSSLAVNALNIAMTQLGKPYVWGAVGPDTYDCSGLVLWAYNNAGYFDMPRTTRGQWTRGASISQDKVQKGDLIYFLNNPLKSPVDHVGIYIGEGKMLHAPRPGKFVEIANVPWNRMVSIRRHF